MPVCGIHKLKDTNRVTSRSRLRGGAQNQRFRRFGGTTALSFLMVGLLPACGVFSSDPTATLVLPESAAVGSEIPVEGSYSDAKAGLEVRLADAGDSGGEPVAVTTTDRSGRFKATIPAETAGSRKFEVTVIDGDESTVSASRAILILGSTGVSVKLDGESEARVDDERSLSGSVEPAKADREVALESSPDGNSWNSTDVSGSTDGKGAFVLTLPTSTTGERYYRAVIARSEEYEKASTEAQYLGVYDYDAAGKYYLGCVEEFNAKVAEFESLPNDLATLTGSAGRMKERKANEAKCLRDYVWPPSVQEDVDAIAGYDDIDSDVWNQMANATSLEEFDDISFTFTDDADPATRIRSRLGLPNRPAT